MAKPWWWAMLAAAGLAGCAVGPDYQRPQMALPAHFGVAGTVLTEAVPAQGWWRAFDEPVLNDLVARALRQNLDVQAAWARVRQARALASAAGGADWPQLSLSAQQTRDRLSLRGEQFANIPFANPQNQFTDTRAGLSASWELDLFGYNARSVEAATARAGSAEAMAQATALATAADVARNYLDLRALQQRAQLAARSAELAAETLRLTRLQQQAGEVGQLAVNQAEAAARNAAAALPPLQAGLRADLDALAVLTGVAPHDLDAQLAPAAPLSDPRGVIGVGLPSELLLRRPDVRRAERDLAAASADVGVATAAQYPRFSLVGSFGVDAVHQGQLTEQASRFWSVGPALSLPLFTGGALSNQLKARQAAYDAALASYRKTVLQALADTETALMRFDRDSARLDEVAGVRRAAESTLDLTRRRVAVGEASQLEALQADSQLLQASDAWVQACAARSATLVGLYQSLGGGW
ncbi:efflux transporter outer membrane subunit [Paludibacterium purpuratum]|uniref:NodT family efflux transporter outer membrane factor (OMF) lipoprotein n=1 Tax=Paludibacterium purpuratum TaxID=1144873 RepID=A0A4R7B561_9NEIS|nr:efflux transporter outer membrane subunit [Paludibacterium purpuratum]TDR79748.1 NodT family efflux transporter outer membrane factor (OMF) lipoprotein [Paludibacterium purpuratum]